MGKIHNVRKIWDNGLESPFPAIKLEDIDEFKKRTSAKRVVAFRWTFGNKEYELPYRMSVLPDKSGIVHCDDGTAASKDALKY
jgi:hypothetical protein